MTTQEEKKTENAQETQVSADSSTSIGIAKKEYVIDAKGKRLGRIATEAASVLLGKDSASFVKNDVADVQVKIVNARLLDISEKKRVQEEFQTYSGYPGGQKRETLGHLIDRRGYGEVLTRTIRGMIPKNKLHKLRMKNLEITE